MMRMLRLPTLLASLVCIMSCSSPNATQSLLAISSTPLKSTYRTNEPIEMRITITNNSSNPIRFPDASWDPRAYPATLWIGNPNGIKGPIEFPLAGLAELAAGQQFSCVFRSGMSISKEGVSEISAGIDIPHGPPSYSGWVGQTMSEKVKITIEGTMTEEESWAAMPRWNPGSPWDGTSCISQTMAQSK